MAKLYVVAIDIGNNKDITLRALEVLKQVDYIICEEFKEARRFLKKHNIKNKLKNLNEHNEENKTDDLLKEILINDKAVALISDAGTPLFADPGNSLVWKCHQNNISVHPVPGPSSIMAALMGSGIIKDKFFYYGFLSANKYERRKELHKIKYMSDTDMVFLEAPYRLKQLLQSMRKKLGDKRDAIVAYKLTQPEEKFFWGNLKELATMTTNLKKGEFVLILRKYKKYR